MKRLVLRLSVLAAVGLLGCFAIAYAQRQGDSADPQEAAAGNSSMTLGTPQSPPAVPTEIAELNPLRGSQGQPGPQQPSPVEYPAQQPAASQSAPPTQPPADLFGPQPASPSQPTNQPQPTNQLPAADPSPAANQSQPAAMPPVPAADDRAVQADSGVPYPANPATGVAAAPNRFEGESSSAPLTNYYAPAVSPATSSNSNAYPSAGERSATSGVGRLADNTAPSGFPAAAQSMGMATRDEGTGRPATDRRLDGQQTPQLSIQKMAPSEIQVGKEAVFRVEVKNTGPVAAENVQIRDQVPAGTTLVSTEPAASRGAQGELTWTFPKLEPGAGAAVEMRVTPLAEGELGSTATVSFSASASVRARSTKPELSLNVTSPQNVMIEGQMTLSITVSNPGSGVATGVVLEEHVPPCLQHPAGAELEYEVGNLAPNESKTLELKLTAIRPGRDVNTLIARADAVAEVRKEMPIEVVAPQLKIEMTGSKNRYLERQATYELVVSNPGTATARDVRLVAELPPGLKFVSANNSAHYDPGTRTVQWALAELPVGTTTPVQLTTLPVEIGQHKFQVQGTAEKAIAVKEEEQITVDGIAAIRFEVVDVQDPIEIGGETVYEIRVLNQGSKEATQVSLEAEVAPGLQITAVEGPDSLGAQRRGDNAVVFQPLARLSPKVDVTYRVRVQGRQAGDQRIRVQLMTAELQSPVTKEESTRVFSDK